MSKGDMQESDLFKAEFVFITDSDEGDEETVSRNSVQQPSVGHGIGHVRCQLLATSHISSGGESSKPPGDLNVPETQCAALSDSATRSPKQRQVSCYFNSPVWVGCACQLLLAISFAMWSSSSAQDGC